MRRSSLIAGCVLLLLAPFGEAQPRSGTQFERIVQTQAPGPHRLVVDEALLLCGAPFRVVRGGETFHAEDGLSDLRLFADGDRPVPYLIVQPPIAEHEWLSGNILRVAPTKKTSGFEVDLGAVQTIDMLRLEGLPSPHLKRVSLEGSGDRQRWTMLVAEGTLFDLPDEKLRQDALGFEPGGYRYLRVTWNDANSGRVPSPHRALARRALTSARPPATTIRTSVERRPSEPGVSRFRVRLPAPALPIVALDIDIGGGHVYRPVIVTEARFSGSEVVPVQLGAATLTRVTRDGVTASALRVPIASPAEAEIDLTADDGANEPLEIRGVSLVLAQLPWIYFEAPAGTVVARYGDRTLSRPVYDLEAVRQSIDLSKLPEARWADDNPRTTLPAPSATRASSMPEPGPSLDPSTFAYARTVDATSAGLAALSLDAHVLAHSRGPDGRFSDVRILDSSNRQIPYLIERLNEPLSIDLVIKSAADKVKSESSGRRTSSYTVVLPYAHLPESTVVIETPARVFQRTARLGLERAPDRHRREAWFDVVEARTWRHADEHTATRPLTLRIGSLPETELRLAIDEGDNAPLPISAVRLLLPSYRLRFYRPENASLRLVYGRKDLQTPQYDLALLAPKVMGDRATEVSASAPASTPISAGVLISPRVFWFVLGGAVVVLLGLIARLIVRHE
jgi:hypothetical protein